MNSKIKTKPEMILSSLGSLVSTIMVTRIVKENVSKATNELKKKKNESKNVNQ